MCHPDIPESAELPSATTREVFLPLSGGEQLPGLLALPERTPAPAVLIINDIFGRGPFYENLARRLARAGYVALDPEFFFREGPLAELTLDAARVRRARLDERRALDELSAAIDWLSARPEVGGNRIGTIGFCMGGTMVLDFAALRPDLAGGVCYYGFPVSAQPGPVPAPIDLVDRMQVPVLGLWGDQDEGVGMPNVARYREAMESAGKPHEFHVYPGVGHGFLKAFLEDAAAPGYAAAADSWRRSLDFLQQRLGAPVVV